jgi:hypothetical protein
MRVSDARMPSFSCLPITRPGVPASTTNAVISGRPPSRFPVRAVKTIVPAYPPLVQYIFAPLTTKCAPSRTAVVRMPCASEPAPGSVSPNAPIICPDASFGARQALLLLGAEGEDRERAERHVRGHGERRRRAVARELLDDDRLRGCPSPRRRTPRGTARRETESAICFSVSAGNSQDLSIPRAGDDVLDEPADVSRIMWWWSWR